MTIDEQLMTRLDIALRQLEAARAHTNDLLQHLRVNDWFRMPHEGVTHIAWQVGHVAASEYALLLNRIRGPRPEDEALISPEFRAKFGKGSVPSKNVEEYPSSADIVGVFDRVHRQVMSELPELTDEMLDQPPESPHPRLQTKFDALCLAPQHEMLHAGEIALLRRLFGEKPLR